MGTRLNVLGFLGHDPIFLASEDPPEKRLQSFCRANDGGPPYTSTAKGVPRRHPPMSRDRNRRAFSSLLLVLPPPFSSHLLLLPLLLLLLLRLQLLLSLLRGLSPCFLSLSLVFS